MPAYLRPSQLDAALAALAERPMAILAGGTDHYPARVGKPLDDAVLDITAIEGLREIVREGAHWRIPALATWSDIVENDRLPPAFDGLKCAAREIGGRQIQNVATLCGNLCNASPAADGIPNLLALDAEIELTSRCGVRYLPIAQFIIGNRQTSRAPDELATAVLIADPTRRTRATFLKLGARRYLVISIVMVAVVVELDDAGTIVAAGFAVGACSAVAVRLPAVERLAIGKRLGLGLAGQIEPQHLDALSPIDDVRGSAEYRRDAALTLLRRAILELGR